jgi:hypothetical protein
MATPIKVVPVLTGAAARRFDRRAEQVLKRKNTIDISEDLKMVERILAESRAKRYDV